MITKKIFTQSISKAISVKRFYTLKNQAEVLYFGQFVKQYILFSVAVFIERCEIIATKTVL